VNSTLRAIVEEPEKFCAAVVEVLTPPSN